MVYGTLYELLVANTKLSEPGNPQSCWLWQASSSKGYPRFSKRVPGPFKMVPRKHTATRAMLEEILQVLFPFDEAGHLCHNSLCINPDHLEVQTRAHNMAQRWGQMACKEAHQCWIPVLFPIEDPLQLIAEELWETPPAPHLSRTKARTQACPF